MKTSTTRFKDADSLAQTRLEELPNVGTAVAVKLRRTGIRSPQDLAGRDPYQLFDKLCRVTRIRHDPCLLDTFIAAVRFMDGGPAKPWWAYTAERKRHLKANRALSRKKR